MNTNQKSAIRKIEDAMKLAGEVGLAFAGVDTELVVFKGSQFRKVSKENNGGSPGEVINDLDYVCIENCNYIDSCAT